MRFLLRPRWLAVHLAVVGIVLLFISLGFWQLRRLDERRADNRLIATNMAAEPQSLADTLEQYGNDPSALTYRRVTVSGTYRAEDEVLLTPRSVDRRAGHHVVTALELDPGQAVLVNRGWVPFAMDTPPVPQAAPPAGQVAVEGILLPTQEAGRYGNNDGSNRVTYLSTVDVDLLQPQFDVALYPFSILLQEQQPSGGELPIPASPPEQTEGSHQSYAGQWFFFAAIVGLGYPLLLRRSLARRRAGADHEAVVG